MLLTVTLAAGQNTAVSTSVGLLLPGSAPIKVNVPGRFLEQKGAELAALEAQGLITLSVTDDTATDDRFQLAPRTSESSSSPTEFQGNDITFYVPVAAGLAGTADDVTIIAPGTFPAKLRVIDCAAIVTTTVVGSTWTLRDSALGAGLAMSSALSSAAAAKVRDALATVTQVMLKPKGLFLHRSDRGTAGEVIVWARAEA